MLVELIKNMDGWFFFPNLQVRRHLVETGKTKIYGKRDEARVCGSKSGRNPRQDHEDEWRQLTCAKSIAMKFTACKEHLPSYKTNTAMLFVTENKDSCDSIVALRFSGHKWEETQRMWQIGGGKRSPPPLHTIVGATHYKVCDFGTLHLKLGINIQIYLF